jgi:hypothetical protein
MNERKKVPFTATSGEPLTLDVTGADGVPYQMQVTLAVFAIYDMGVRQPAVSPDTGTIPMFEIQAQVASITRVKTP